MGLPCFAEILGQDDRLLERRLPSWQRQDKTLLTQEVEYGLKLEPGFVVHILAGVELLALVGANVHYRTTQEADICSATRRQQPCLHAAKRLEHHCQALDRSVAIPVSNVCLCELHEWFGEGRKGV